MARQPLPHCSTIFSASSAIRWDCSRRYATTSTERPSRQTIPRRTPSPSTSYWRAWSAQDVRIASWNAPPTPSISTESADSTLRADSSPTSRETTWTITRRSKTTATPRRCSSTCCRRRPSPSPTLTTRTDSSWCKTARRASRPTPSSAWPTTGRASWSATSRECTSRSTARRSACSLSDAST